MYTSLITFDNFYTNPLDVYEFAIKQSYFDRTYNCSIFDKYSLPCKSSSTFSSQALQDVFQRIVYPLAGNITSFDLSNNTLNGSFIVLDYDKKPMINVLNSERLQNTWIGVVFLTPNTNNTTGIKLYKHNSIPSNNNYPNTYLRDIEMNLTVKERFDFTKWEEVDYIGNVFNKLVCFRANNYHQFDVLSEYNGILPLNQIFVFDTEY
jgi:hypothetical protein